MGVKPGLSLQWKNPVFGNGCSGDYLDLRRTGWKEFVVTNETLHEAEVVLALRMTGTVCGTHSKDRAVPPGLTVTLNSLKCLVTVLEKDSLHCGVRTGF